MRVVLVLIALSVVFTVVAVRCWRSQPALASASAGFAALFGGLFLATYFQLI
ncbi:MAG: hypothetical protein KDK91_19660 [Gammaproteobacteria bacterium]|nr:hypothetical protein [Gammaproteobacteria bacterium]